MRIGVINMPGRNTYKGQSLKTRFFILGLPLFPTGCYYKISDNLGISIPISGKDILHAYAKIHFGLLGVVGLFWASNMRGSGTIASSLVTLISLALIGFCIYSWAAYSEVSKEEKTNRRIFGKAFLYNMAPEYLPKHVQKSLFGELLKTYFGKFGQLDWEDDIRNGQLNKENYPLLYTLAYYQKTMVASPTNEALFAEVASYLKEGKKLPKEEATATNFTGSAQQFAEPSSRTEWNKGANKTNDTTHTSASTKSTKATVEPMSSQDIFKLQDARQQMLKQLFMVGGFFLVGFIVVAIISGGTTLLGPVFLIVLTFFVVISSVVFLPGYLRIGKDISKREKMKIKVRIKDMVEEYGTAYLVLQSNRYGISKLTAPAKYYSTGLLNKELEIYVGKTSHTLLEILGARY